MISFLLFSLLPTIFRVAIWAEGAYSESELETKSLDFNEDFNKSLFFSEDSSLNNIFLQTRHRRLATLAIDGFIPDSAFDFPSNNICVDVKKDIKSFSGSWILDVNLSDRLDEQLRYLDQWGIAIRAMRSATPVSIYTVNEDGNHVHLTTKLPYRRTSESNWDLNKTIVSHYDSPMGITWRNIKSGFNADIGALYSSKTSDYGTMFDVGYVCEDENGSLWQVWHFTLDGLESFRWSKKQ